ncbi:MAG: mobile mystery protein A [Flavobacteriales bacterium]|nr:mobile mystery protein A [Flavobacteriales bacterium]
MSKLTKLRLRQLDEQLVKASGWPMDPPPGGWLATLRKALRMPLHVLATRLDMTPTGAKRLEQREADGSITLQVLRKAAEAMNMRLIYVLVPKDGSLQKLIERRALEAAREIVERVDQSMRLEAQSVSRERIAEAIKEKAEELQRDLSKELWR